MGQWHQCFVAVLFAHDTGHLCVSLLAELFYANRREPYGDGAGGRRAKSDGEQQQRADHGCCRRDCDRRNTKRPRQ